MGGLGRAGGDRRHPTPVAANTDPSCNFGGVASLGDIAVGVPGESVNGMVGVGGVDVIIDPATAGGTHVFLTAPTDLMADSHIGFSLACGDFNGDGIDDIAAGAPHRDEGRGRVYVFHSDGMGGFGQVAVLDQEILGSTPEQGALFGFSLAAADFTGDGIDDLAIGAPKRGLVGQYGPYGAF